MSLHTKFTGITGCETRQATGGTGSELQRRDRERGVTAPGARACGLDVLLSLSLFMRPKWRERPAGRGKFTLVDSSRARARDRTDSAFASTSNSRKSKIVGRARGSRSSRPYTRALRCVASRLSGLRSIGMALPLAVPTVRLHCPLTLQCGRATCCRCTPLCLHTRRPWNRLRGYATSTHS
jgi:hypothetical protein